jgi:hypothetical protein
MHAMSRGLRRDGCTPLHLSAINDRMQATRVLVDIGASRPAVITDFAQVAASLLGAARPTHPNA